MATISCPAGTRGRRLGGEKPCAGGGRGQAGAARRGPAVLLSFCFLAAGRCPRIPLKLAAPLAAACLPHASPCVQQQVQAGQGAGVTSASQEPVWQSFPGPGRPEQPASSQLCRES